MAISEQKIFYSVKETLNGHFYKKKGFFLIKKISLIQRNILISFK